MNLVFLIFNFYLSRAIRNNKLFIYIIFLGIPYALHQSGIGMGIILLLLIAAATDYSLCIMIKAGTLAGVTTYQVVFDLMQVVLILFKLFLKIIIIIISNLLLFA